MTAFEHEDLQFIDFPNDDRLWWIRWADEYSFPYPGTDTAGIHVSIESLPFSDVTQITPDDIQSIVKLPPNKSARLLSEGDSSVPRVIKRTGVLAGGIPAIRIGDVYRCGKFVGQLPLPKKTFSFDTSKTLPTIRRVGDEIKPPPSEWRSKTHPCRVINPYDFHLQGLGQSNCQVIDGVRETVIIPCQEIFRIFFAPHSSLANALSQQHWGQALESFVDIAETKSLPPNIWQVALRKRLPGSALRILCALILDEHTRIATKRITTRFRSNNPWIEASLPFPPGEIKFKARYVQLQRLNGKPRVLVTEITNAPWSYAAVIQRLEEEREPESGKPVQHTSPPRQITNRFPGQEIDPEREKVESVTPSVHIKPVSAFARGFAWENPPAIRTVHTHVSSGGSPVDVRFAGSPPVEKPTSSTGVPKGGRTSSGEIGIVVQRERTFITRYRLLKEIFDRMLSADEIDDWHLVSSPFVPVRINGIDVWAVPNKTTGKSNAWCSIPGSKAPRVAIVFQLVKESASAYFLELEGRHSEGGFRYVLFAPREGSENLCITELLQVAANQEGVWPNSLTGNKNLPSLLQATTYKHSSIKNHKLEKSKEGERLLNGNAIANAVMVLLDNLNRTEY